MVFVLIEFQLPAQSVIFPEDSQAERNKKMRCLVTPFAFNDPFARVRSLPASQSQSNRGPLSQVAPVTIRESDSNVTIEFDVPGFKDDDLEITVNNGELLVTGKREAEIPSGAKLMFNNRQAGSLERVIKLDDSLDPESVDAVLEFGVLKIMLSRKPEKQPTPVRIRSST
ncbi:MAG TPA: Hsp20/alpha crystallin family protein [Planctomycetes bacterium]|nr:Hsp20/alpha crystallin family protein [Fuerstiella sp.]HIK92570.1 Hsp20/alpha crystallin family protein [Planctomycetota bacterium]